MCHVLELLSLIPMKFELTKTNHSKHMIVYG
jgi:hypothetical protein